MQELTKQEQALYLDFVLKSQHVSSVEDFQSFVRRYFRPLFPHGMTLACLGALINGKAVLEMAVAVDYPDALFEKVHEIVSIGDRALLARWYMERKPQIISRGVNDQLLSRLERHEMDFFDFDNFFAHGIVDLDGKKGSYISLARIPGQLTEHHTFLMELMVPHIHQILIRIWGRAATQALFATRNCYPQKNSSCCDG